MDSEGCWVVAIIAFFAVAILVASVTDSCERMHEREMKLKYGKEPEPVQETEQQKASNPACECTHRLWGHLQVVKIASGQYEPVIGDCVAKDCECENFRLVKE